MDAKPISVLLVDDDQDTQTMIHAVMDHYHYHFVVANDAQEAIDYLTHNATDIVLLDIYLPDRNGYDTLKIIRNDTRSQAKIIAITAYYTDETPTEMINRGFDGYLPKPLSPTELGPYIQNLL